VTEARRKRNKRRPVNREALVRYTEALDRLAAIDEAFTIAAGVTPRGKGRRFIRSTWKGRVYLRRYTVPRNPKTPAQQAQRGRLTEAVAAWRALSDEEHRRYDEAARDKRLTGYNLFVSEFLNARRRRSRRERATTGGTSA